MWLQNCPDTDLSLIYLLFLKAHMGKTDIPYVLYLAAFHVSVILQLLPFIQNTSFFHADRTLLYNKPGIRRHIIENHLHVSRICIFKNIRDLIRTADTFIVKEILITVILIIVTENIITLFLVSCYDIVFTLLNQAVSKPVHKLQCKICRFPDTVFCQQSDPIQTDIISTEFQI